MAKVVSVLVLLLLAACGGEQSTNTIDKRSVEQKSALEKTIQPQLDALEKAKGVEEALEQQKLERDKRMSEQGI